MPRAVWRRSLEVPRCISSTPGPGCCRNWLDVLFTSPLYPYNAEEDFRVLSASRKTCGAKIPLIIGNICTRLQSPSIIPMTWTALSAEHEGLPRLFCGLRPIYIYAHSFVGPGLFRAPGTGAMARITSGHPGDIFAYAYYMDASYKVLWLNQICDCEYAWNTAAPGSEPFNGCITTPKRITPNRRRSSTIGCRAPAARSSVKSWAMPWRRCTRPAC